MKRIIFSLCIAAFLFSCASDDDTQQVTQQPPVSNFYALTVGNTWVYKSFEYNSNTMEYEDSGIVDTVTIINTEMLNGETYFKFKTVTTGNDSQNPHFNQNGEQFNLYRETEGNLVNNTGDTVYTNNNYQERLVATNTWGNIYDKLKENTVTITVNAGNFTCLDMERYAKSPDNSEVFPGLDHIYYSDGIGLISESISFVSQNYPIGIRRLESYTLQ
ncbi:hypothetical protein [Lacinutrix sp. MedPE-SW]|uniref:hypothetical protein n=1 Tax=Lacinutrix sp. MedPE-SW TaxID=1860087 RepID=UPI00091EC843|nr:hypothetical protein [Lacinutrix sp. MedPE-SW]OIQ21944.1 MAG: hypothetical protein BM549_08400 [Lacinutrix sp. MedPE-SW]